jgi:hypothetical protein
LISQEEIQSSELMIEMTYMLIFMTWTAASGNWITQQIPYADRNTCEAMAEMINSVKPTQAKMQKARCVSQGQSGTQSNQ